LSYLDKELVEEEANYDSRPGCCTRWRSIGAVDRKQGRGREVGKFQAKAFNNLWTNRDKLNAYTRALLALAAHNLVTRQSEDAGREPGKRREDRFEA
jgi:hypothetical protein